MSSNDNLEIKYQDNTIVDTKSNKIDNYMIILSIIFFLVISITIFVLGYTMYKGEKDENTNKIVITTKGKLLNGFIWMISIVSIIILFCGLIAYMSQAPFYVILTFGGKIIGGFLSVIAYILSYLK